MYGLKKKSGIILVLASFAILLAMPTSAHAGSPNINLPPSQVSMKVNYPGSDCYYNVILKGVPSGYHISSGTYLGWCVDVNHYIYSGKRYRAKMYSPYDPNNPLKNLEWDKINYILNHKKCDKWGIQKAIWYFVTNGANSLTEEAQEMVNEANEYGDGFVPAPGQTLAIILWINDNTQACIIEVTVPLHNVVPEYPLGTILGVVTFIAALSVFRYRHNLPKTLKVFHA